MQRYANHSCDPNLVAHAVDLAEIGFSPAQCDLLALPVNSKLNLVSHRCMLHAAPQRVQASMAYHEVRIEHEKQLQRKTVVLVARTDIGIFLLPPPSSPTSVHVTLEGRS